MLTPYQIAQIHAAAKQPPRPTLHRIDQHHSQPRIPSLWHPYIPRGGLTLLAAPPGAGKTSLALDLAARVSRGLPMPDGSTAPQTPASVLLISPEDHSDDTARRLHDLHADPSRIHVSPVGPGVLLEDLEDMFLEISTEHIFTIIDPITAFLPNPTPGEVFHFAIKAEFYNFPILLTVPLRHSVYSIHDLPRSLNSLASYPRSILSLVTPPSTLETGNSGGAKLETPPDRLLLPIKTNAAALPPPLPFTLGQTLTWHPINPEAPAPLDPALQEAVDFLKDFLSPNPQLATTVLQSASQNLITRHNLYRAKHHLKIDSRRPEYQAPYNWYLPSTTPQVPSPKLAEPADR